MKHLILFIFFASTLQSQVVYDTIIDRGLYKIFFNKEIRQPVAVVYKLYCGGGSADRANDHFTGDKITLSDKDYKHSGFDRGHMVPAEDFAFSDSLQALTFKYYNCVPQNPKLNRGSWKKYENKVRALSWHDTVTVICYNQYTGTKQGTLNIPDRCYKVVYNSKNELLLAIGFQNNLRCTEEKLSATLSNMLASLSK